MKLYVGNLSFNFQNSDLESAFQAYGEVVSATVIKDKISGKSKGFGFVEMSDSESGNAAIDGLNGKDLGGRNVTVSEARPKEDNGSRPKTQNRRPFSR